MILSQSAKLLIQAVDQAEKKIQKSDTEVNPLVSEMAVWYEKLRNALEYQEEEVILRAAIARILRRRLVLGKKNEPVAEPLIRELIWAKYFPENTIPAVLVRQIEEKIGFYLQLREVIYKQSLLLRSKKQNYLTNGTVDEWINQLMSSDIENVLHKQPAKDYLISFAFKIFKSKINIYGESEETRDAQVYIAIKKAFAKEDLAMLRFGLFQQIYGELNEKNVERIGEKFIDGYKEINKQLEHPLKDAVYSYVRRYMPAFFILFDIFETHKGNMHSLVQDEKSFEGVILKACENRYKQISRKISTAIMRSIIFILLTKAVFALLVETTFERMLYGDVKWMAIGINILSAPVLMFFTTFFIKSPGKENSFKIVESIKDILVEENSQLIKPIELDRKKAHTKASFVLIYGILWMIAVVMGVFAINYVLNFLEFPFISKMVFFFFLAIVSFLCYRISQIPRMLMMQREKQGVRSLLFDFFFVPFIQIGKALTVGIAQINIFLFIFDYLIEAPFKEIFSFIEQWLFFLRSQRESLD